MEVKNLVVYDENVGKLSKEITGYVSSESALFGPPKVQGDINIDSDMIASTQVGKVRENQEDAVLLMKHEKNEKYKMMVVADGMGGHMCGEKASHVTVQEIKAWFNSLSEASFKDENQLIESLKAKLHEINEKIIGWKNDAGTTFVCALVAENNTYIVNIGDSRAYMIQGKEFTQITEDDSYAYDYYKQGLIKRKDDIRFARNGHVISNCLGLPEDMFRISVQSMPNNAYQAILLFSDGVTDCLSDDEIFAVTKSTDSTEVAKKVVQAALNNESKRKRIRAADGSIEPDRFIFNRVIHGGKDNATAAVLFNNPDDQEGPNNQGGGQSPDDR